MRLVLDTSVIVSAVRSFSGASNVLINAAFQQRFELLLSVPLVFEYESVLMRPEQMAVSGLSNAQIEDMLLGLLRIAVRVELEDYTGPSSLDPDDNHLLSLATHGQADAIVTHNVRDLLGPSEALGVNLYTPGAALRFMRN